MGVRGPSSQTTRRALPYERARPRRRSLMRSWAIATILLLSACSGNGSTDTGSSQSPVSTDDSQQDTSTANNQAGGQSGGDKSADGGARSGVPGGFEGCACVVVSGDHGGKGGKPPIDKEDDGASSTDDGKAPGGGEKPPVKD